MKKIINLVILLLIVLLQSACARPEKGKGVLVAKVYNKYLYETDLHDVLYPGISKYDSIIRVQSFIDNWVRKQLLLVQAEKNLDQKQYDFSKQLVEYRNSLITFTYETELVNQNLDTIVTNEEIEHYYKEHPQNFTLHHNLVKTMFVVIPDDLGNQTIKQFETLLSNCDTLLSDSLSSMVQQYAVTNFLDYESWIRFDDLLQKIPLEVFNQESFLKKNKFVKFDKDSFTYMIRINDFTLKESLSPLELESEKIKNIIINKRKKDFLKKMNDDIYEKAVKEKAFEIF